MKYLVFLIVLAACLTATPSPRIDLPAAVCSDASVELFLFEVGLNPSSEASLRKAVERCQTELDQAAHLSLEFAEWWDQRGRPLDYGGSKRGDADLVDELARSRALVAATEASVARLTDIFETLDPAATQAFERALRRNRWLRHDLMQNVWFEAPPVGYAVDLTPILREARRVNPKRWDAIADAYEVRIDGLLRSVDKLMHRPFLNTRVWRRVAFSGTETPAAAMQMRRSVRTTIASLLEATARVATINSNTLKLLTADEAVDESCEEVFTTLRRRMEHQVYESLDGDDNGWIASTELLLRLMLMDRELASIPKVEHRIDGWFAYFEWDGDMDAIPEPFQALEAGDECMRDVVRQARRRDRGRAGRDE